MLFRSVSPDPPRVDQPRREPTYLDTFSAAIDRLEKIHLGQDDEVERRAAESLDATPEAVGASEPLCCEFLFLDVWRGWGELIGASRRCLPAYRGSGQGEPGDGPRDGEGQLYDRGALSALYGEVQAVLGLRQWRRAFDVRAVSFEW